MKFVKTMAAAALVLGVMSQAQAGAIITDGKVQLGVDDLGNLNIYGGAPSVVRGTTVVGLRYLAPNGEYEATSHGCFCEGWGVAIDGTSNSGYANNDKGTNGLTLVNFSSTATTATSVVNMGSLLNITHSFALAAQTPNLYRVQVSIQNTGASDINNLLYRRTFDWDTEPTVFNEYVTIGGTASATTVKAASNNGFCTSNPLVVCDNSLLAPTFYTGDFTTPRSGDQGANFDFNFGKLAAGSTYTFDIFYGAAENKTAALNALGRVGAEVFSMGWSGSDADQNGFADGTTNITPTFIFGFAGVGGVKLPDPVPAPASALLLGLGLFGLAMNRRQRKTA